MVNSRLTSRRRQDQGSKWGRILIAILATIGVIDTSSITLERLGIIGELTCPGGGNGCNKVLESAWGTISLGSFSYPLSIIGFISYLIVLILAIVPFLPGLSKKKNNLSRPTWWALFYIATCMFIFSGLLMFIMINNINSFCLFCVLSALISTLILGLTIFKGGWEEPRDLIFKGIIISIIVLLLGLIWSSSVNPNRDQKVKNNFGIPPLVISESNASSIALAEHLTSIGAKQYSAYWCPHCHDQKELFGKEAVSKLIVIECDPKGKDNKYELCQRKGITGYPSWEINGKIESGVQSLSELSKKSNYKGPKDF